MFKIIKSIVFPTLFTTNQIPIEISTLKEVRYDSTKLSQPNKWFNVDKSGGIMVEYYNGNDKVGYIRYYITTGQIGLFFIERPFQNRGIGKQILSKTINELKENNCEECWVVTVEGHSFWSNVFDKSFTYRDPAHSSVTGGGYYKILK
jgi:GNAT superfamily N-acetyltransferase